MSQFISLLNKIIKSNINVIKTVNLVYQNRSLSKDIMLMYLQPHVWYSGGKIIAFSDKNEMCN